MYAEPQQEHRWLDQLVGDWDYEGECTMGPDQPPMKAQGTETVRSLGGLWTIGEGEGHTPDGSTSRSIMTLGFDPKANRYVGTYVLSIMSFLWVYSGALDSTGKILALDTEGPSFTGDAHVKYQDRIEIVDSNHRILSSQTLGEDGHWREFMTVHYRRKI